MSEQGEPKTPLEWLLTALLAAIPAAIALHMLHAAPNLVFVASALGIIPLAGIMGDATEVLAEHLGPGIGGLLNATFGNAAELIIAFFALKEGLHEVVKASITGSIIGNILLVLGASIVLGGTKYKTQKFNLTAAGAGTTMLALSVIALVIPTVFHQTVKPAQPLTEHELSLAIAGILFLTYLLGLLFQLRTHKHLYMSEESDQEAAETGPDWSVRRATAILVVATCFVALLSEFLVGSIEKTAETWGMNHVFMGVILLAIIGNAAEHSTAVMMAMKNKMNLVMSIAVGSSIQIALFVAPMLVFVSYGVGQPLDLIFGVFEVLAVVMAVAVVTLISSDGETNWLEGVHLLAVYGILAFTFFFLPAGGKLPVAGFDVTPPAPAAGEMVFFDAGRSFQPGVDIDRLEWDLDGDGTFDTTTVNRRLPYRYEAAGTHAVKLRVVDRAGATSTAERIVGVRER